MDDGCRKKMQIFLSDGQNIRGFLLAETSKMSIWKNPTASTVQSLRSATYSWVGSRRLVFLFSAPSPEQEFPATNRTLFICWLVHKIQNKFFLETLLDRPTYTELPRNRTLFTDSINPSWRVMTSSMANLESLMTSPVGIFGNDWRKVKKIRRPAKNEPRNVLFISDCSDQGRTAIIDVNKEAISSPTRSTETRIQNREFHQAAFKLADVTQAAPGPQQRPCAKMNFNLVRSMST